MASTNQSPFYQRAEADFHKASTDEERISCLQVMIKECPKHKSSESMLRNLTTRLKKLEEGLERKKRAGKSSKEGIKKAEMQCVLMGLPNSGKSSLFNALTNTNSTAKVSPHPFSTLQPLLGTLEYEDVKIQIIDDAPFPNHDRSLINSTDTLLVVVDSLEQIKQLESVVWKSPAKKIFLFTKTDVLGEVELRKLEATLKSKFKHLVVLLVHHELSSLALLELKKKIFLSFPIIRVYTKEPKKPASTDPMILRHGSSLAFAAEKILKGMSKRVIRARIWGPSSKFGGQSVGLDHILKDKDVVEFITE